MSKPTKWVCAQRRLRSAWASAQTDQSLHYPHEESLGPKLPIDAQRRLWSDWADAPADLSLRWVHSHFVGFVTSRLKQCLSYWNNKWAGAWQKPTKWPVHPVKTQTAMSNQSLLPAWKRFSFKATHNVYSEDSDQNGWMPRLTWATAGHTDHLSQLMRFWYLSHRWQRRLRQPLLFAHMKYGNRQRVRPKIRHLASLDGWACAFEEWAYGRRKEP